jgi:hypothetical protein
MKISYYLDLKKTLIEDGYADEIDWQTNLEPVTNSLLFRDETIWVILNSGMKEQIARIIHGRIWHAINNGEDISKAFGHKQKVAAIKFVLKNFATLFNGYLNSDQKIDYLKDNIPFIGGITKYHLAKNLGHDCVKPDRHLVRIAKEYGFTDCVEMCRNISAQTGDKVCVIDIVLWRAANLGLI